MFVLCFFFFVYANGDKYDGDWNDEEMNGKGVYYYANGDKYDGEFNHNKKNGKGVFYYANGGKYDGEWKDNKKSGKGVYYYINNDNIILISLDHRKCSFYDTYSALTVFKC